MSSPTNAKINKQPFKVIEIPLNKFNHEAVPHHMLLLEQHKHAVHKFMQIKNNELLSREIRDRKRTVRQLKDLLYELDTLRARVEDEELDKFDSQTMSLRRTISAMIKDYVALQKSAGQFMESQNEINENIENENPFLGASEIQMQDSLGKLKLQEESNRLRRVEALNEDIHDMHGIFQELNTMVHTQKESVDVIEENVENTTEHVNEGLNHIIKAYKLKTTAYPVTGALIGSLVGGPLGFVAGFKVGGLAALGCGLMGYTGGKFFKKFNDKTVTSESDTNVDIVDNDTKVDDKKDI